MMPTDFTDTGQRSETASFGLMYYNARWYDFLLGRFVKADMGGFLFFLHIPEKYALQYDPCLCLFIILRNYVTEE
jgi:hypothetical protein